MGDRYLETMGTPILAGRDFTAGDGLHAPPVAIVNEQFARKLVPGGTALGRRFRTEPPARSPLYEIVGVVRDTKYRSMREDFLPLVFLPMNQDASPGRRDYQDILVRTRLPLASVAGALGQTVAETEPRLIIDFEPFDRLVSQSMIRERLLAMLAGFFGVLAALLAAIGLYGVVSYSVARRTREIGIRMALGAGKGSVSRMIARESATVVAMGLLAGLGLGLLAARAAAAMLYGLPPHDPLTVALAAALMAAVAAAASLMPARRAANVDPVIALRAE